MAMVPLGKSCQLPTTVCQRMYGVVIDTATLPENSSVNIHRRTYGEVVTVIDMTVGLWCKQCQYNACKAKGPLARARVLLAFCFPRVLEAERNEWCHYSDRKADAEH